MRASLAFMNGAGSRRNLKSGSTNLSLLMLTDLLVATGLCQAGFRWQSLPRTLSARRFARRGFR